MSTAPYSHYKSTGTEWPVQIPSTWDLVSIKRLAILVYGDALPSEKRDENGGVPVFGSNGAFGNHNTANTSSPAILVGRKGSCGALNWSEVAAFAIDTVYFIDAEHSRCNLRWLFWALHTANLSNLSQDTGVPGLAREMAYEVKLPRPSQIEQTAIAAFLDRETAKIDALVEEQKRLIELLKEKRQAVISHAVTKGLNPDARMKDSGIEWLGKVPEHWAVRPIRSIASVVRGASPRPAGDPRFFGDEGVPWVTVGGITKDDQLTLNATAEYLTEEGSLLSRKFTAGTLIYSNSGATLGVPKILGLDACANDGVLGFERLSPAVDSEFMYYYLSSITGAIRDKIKQGSGQPNLNTDIVKSLLLPCPSRSEQQAIVKHLRTVLAGFAQLKQISAQAVELLEERRSALISAAVTGKIDVRTPPSRIDSDRVRLVVGKELVHRLSHRPMFGRVKFQKMVYLTEAYAGVVELSGSYIREAAGPLDRGLLADIEGLLKSHANVTISQPDGPGGAVRYKVKGGEGNHATDLDDVLRDRRSKFNHLVDSMAHLDTKGSEAVATLFAVWNDALIDQETVTDDSIVIGFLTDWHPEKSQKFRAPELHTWLGWMRRHNIVPTGRGPKTSRARLLL